MRREPWYKNAHRPDRGDGPISGQTSGEPLNYTTNLRTEILTERCRMISRPWSRRRCGCGPDRICGIGDRQTRNAPSVISLAMFERERAYEGRSPRVRLEVPTRGLPPPAQDDLGVRGRTWAREPGSAGGRRGLPHPGACRTCVRGSRGLDVDWEVRSHACRRQARSALGPGISSQRRPSSSRPSDRGVRPSHCLKKKGTCAATHRSRMPRAQRMSMGR